MTGKLQQLTGADDGFRWGGEVIAHPRCAEHTPMKVRSILQHRCNDFTSIDITPQQLWPHAITVRRHVA
ncbi:hypothetical protein B1F75_11050 [Pseudomonas syringae]|nr:hypothetical protein B1F71_06235 [Pseudomonas syringae]RXT94237.1 hypothetical protein B1F75_11050 [Pseudomonas syringae]